MSDDTSSKVSQILNSAESILRDHGDHGMTMRKVAQGAGISLGHLQHYFPTKNDLLIAIIGNYFERCGQALDEFAGQQTSTDVAERGQALWRSVFLLLVAN